MSCDDNYWKYIHMKIFSKKYFFIVKVLFFVVLLLSCATENKPTYILTADVSPHDAGLIVQSSIEAQEGDSIKVIAFANEHWVFSGWSGDISDSQSTVNVVMNADRHITALFEKREYPLMVEVEGEGKVKEEVIQAKTTDYPHGTMVKLTAEPEFGWEFSHWDGVVSSEDNEIELLIEGETHIKAVFELKIFDLNIEIEGEGKVKEEVIQLKSTEYPFGTFVQLTAEPEDGWRFSHWDGAVSSEDDVVEILIEGEINIKAVFELKIFDLNIEIDGNGSVEKREVQAKSSSEHPFGTIVELSAVPEYGWKFVRWEGDIEDVGEPVVQLLIDSNKEVIAIFEKADFSLSVNVEGEGYVEQQVVQAKSVDYTFGTVIQLTAIPEIGWEFVGWRGDFDGTNSQITVTIDKDRIVEAVFRRQDFQLNIQVNGQGFVNTQANQGGHGLYPFETKVLLNAVPADGWVFAGFSGSVVSNHNPIEVEMTQNLTLVVDFVPLPAQKRILPLGDSITNGVPHSYRFFLFNMLAGSGYNFNYVGSKNTNPANYPGVWDTRHEGNNGATSRAIDLQLEHWLTFYYTPDIALIHLGTNDITNSITQPNQYEFTITYMESIIDKLRDSNPVIRIYLANIIPFDSTFDPIYNQRVNEWNNWINKIISRKSNDVSPIYHVNMNSNFGDKYFEDGFHPNEAGAKEMANRWFNALIEN